MAVPWSVWELDEGTHGTSGDAMMLRTPYKKWLFALASTSGQLIERDREIQIIRFTREATKRRSHLRFPLAL